MTFPPRFVLLRTTLGGKRKKLKGRRVASKIGKVKLETHHLGGQE
jgi:hypothetical protein